MRDTAGPPRDPGHAVIDPRARDLPVLVGTMTRGIRDIGTAAGAPRRLARRTRPTPAARIERARSWLPHRPRGADC